MSKDKYSSIFSPQLEATCIMFIILQIFFARRAVLNWGIFSDKLRPSIYTRLKENTNCLMHSENIPLHPHVQSSHIYRAVNNVM